MKKFIVLIFLLTLPVIFLAKNVMAADPIKELTQKLESQSKHKLDTAFSTSSSLDQAFEDFKKDPIGQAKIYWNNAKIFFLDMIKLMQNAYEELKKKAS
jgi:hypothetical protein